MKCLKNKKGKLLTLWWFIILVIIAVGIMISTLLFYSKEIDVRGIEAQVLGERIFSCLVKQGEINSVFLSSSEFNVLEKCGINKALIQDNEKYFIKLSVNSHQVRLYGTDFETECKISGIIEAKKYPVCNILNYYGEKNLTIITGSNYMGDNLYDKK
jgi:hypothetical protein